MTDDQARFARLLSLCKIQEAQIKANPTPYLNDITERYVELRDAVNRALLELSGATAYDIAADEFPHMPPSIVETAHIRNRKAQDILAKAIGK